MAQEISRRHFLRQMAAGAAGLAALGAGVGELVGLGAPTPVPVLALSDGVILPDPSLCIGCLTCEVICSRVHREQGLSAVPRIRIYNDATVTVNPEILEHYPDRGTFTMRACKMCPNPECLPGRLPGRRREDRRPIHQRGQVYCLRPMSGSMPVRGA